MTNEDHGGPAFPNDRTMVNGGVVCSTGMTLRDYFAAKAMQGLIQQDVQQTDWCMSAAKLAYQMADAMIAARK
jgi:hypothetical protein